MRENELSNNVAGGERSHAQLRVNVARCRWLQRY